MCGHRNDPFITYLKSYGYNAIRLPRADIRPLQILARQGRELTWLGELADVFHGPAAMPAVEFDLPAAGISGERSGELSIGVALSLLGNIIAAFGGAKLGLGASYKGARSAVFEFPAVHTDRTSVAKLDQFLARSDVDPDSLTVGKLLDADEIYVTTSTIKSRKFILDAKTQSGATLDLDVPVISEVAGGSVKVEAVEATAGKLSYEGPVPLVFGFQAVQLFYTDGAYTALKPADDVALKAPPTADDDGTKRLLVDGAFAVMNWQ